MQPAAILTQRRLTPIPALSPEPVEAIYHFIMVLSRKFCKKIFLNQQNPLDFISFFYYLGSINGRRIGENTLVGR
jgi:hypothetical protein